MGIGHLDLSIVHADFGEENSTAHRRNHLLIVKLMSGAPSDAKSILGMEGLQLDKLIQVSLVEYLD